jgi:hypothetical protein
MAVVVIGWTFDQGNATESRRESPVRTLHPVASSLQSMFTTLLEEWMSYDKRYVAQKRQRRRRKTAKGKVKLYEQGKIPHDKLPALAKKFLSRKMRDLKRAV